MGTEMTQSPGTTSGWLRLAGRAAGAVASRIGVADGRPLPRLADVHPQTASATRRWRGLVTVPVGDIIGTASYPPGMRRSDFLPTDGAVTGDWRARWQHLEEAAQTLAPLPPIEVLKFGAGYWVVDGHNRVALARATGQRWLDADVTELFLRPPHQSRATAQGAFN
jgi:hypothetical protein